MKGNCLLVRITAWRAAPRPIRRPKPCWKPTKTWKTTTALIWRRLSLASAKMMSQRDSRHPHRDRRPFPPGAATAQPVAGQTGDETMYKIVIRQWTGRQWEIISTVDVYDDLGDANQAIAALIGDISSD